MTSDFNNKIKPGMVNGLSKAAQKQNVEQEAKENNEISFKKTTRSDMGTGVAGRSSVNVDNFDTDMRKFFKSPQFAQAANKYVEHLVNQGYNYEEAVNAVFSELGV